MVDRIWGISADRPCSRWAWAKHARLEMLKYIVTLIVILSSGCLLPPNAKNIGNDKNFVKKDLKVTEDKFTKIRTYTGPEFMSKESTFAPEANWISMDKIEDLDRSWHKYRLLIRTYRDSGEIAFYSSAYDDTGAQLNVLKSKQISSKEEVTIIILSADDIRRITERDKDTEIKIISESDEMILLLPKGYVVDFMSATP